MWKGVALFVLCFSLILGASIFLQPSSQESALSSLAAVEGVLNRVEASGAQPKLDDARKILAELRLPPQAQTARDKVVLLIDAANASLGTDQAKVTAATSEIRALIIQTKGNLTSPTAAERARGVKEQILILAWPLVIATLILYVLNSGSSLDFLTRLGSLVSNVKMPGGLEIAFASTVVKRTQEDVIRGYRQQVIDQYDAVAAQNKISETVSRIIVNRITPFFDQQSLSLSDLRCTVHVRDILFENSLYQLIDYLPRKWATLGKGGKGRAWSVRYGMMGRSWRMEQNGAHTSIPTDEATLVKDWGMTKTEAESGSGRQTMYCHIVRGGNKSPVAILYLDAGAANAFGNSSQMSQLETIVDDAMKEYELDKALEKVWQQVQDSAPLIEIYAARR